MYVSESYNRIMFKLISLYLIDFGASKDIAPGDCNFPLKMCHTWYFFVFFLRFWSNFPIFLKEEIISYKFFFIEKSNS